MVHEQDSNEDIPCFVDTDINSFRIEEFPREEKEQPAPLDKEVQKSSDDENPWTMYFDGDRSKEGSSAGVLFISPHGRTFKFSFTLSFACTNNVAEYEVLLLGLRLAKKHGIKNLKFIGDSELVIS
ncbi:uncharacterized protein LOC131052788 [Cryptomeria japonica]|uniref:uncharacterized protein LOC131052788 n=1 Tax=Cryptomeria japonica TaxID=3369 RepID=UPI0025AC5313|nr:uncharacterized protein LOC131052788 [Cryptomeria japonica]